ncbi:hypothetical protein ACHAWF_009228 [Thalassiosira exigua]
MKNELFVLAKMAMVFSVVDAFIPRAETLAKSKMNQHDRSKREGPEKSESPPRYHFRTPQRPPTEVHMGLFDMNPFHGSGSGGTQEALDEQWEEILRARRGEKGHYVKKRKVEIPKVEIKSKAGTAVKVDADDAHHHKKSHAPKFFWDIGK